MAPSDGKVSHCIGWRHIVAQHDVRADKISCLALWEETESLFLVIFLISFSRFSHPTLTRSIQAMCAMNSDELFCKQQYDGRNIDLCIKAEAKLLIKLSCRLTGISHQKLLNRSTEVYEQRLRGRLVTWNGKKLIDGRLQIVVR